MKEKERRTASGFVYLALLVLIALGLLAALISAGRQVAETGDRWAPPLIYSCWQSICSA